MSAMRDPVAQVQGALHVAAFLDPHHQDADEREEDAHARDHHGQQDGAHPAEVVARGHDLAAQHHGRQDGRHVAAEQVGAHAGHVAHVVAHVVGDGGRVARVVLGNARLDLAHQVGAHVGRLGVDAAAHAGKERNALGAQREAREHLQRALHLQPVGRGAVHEHPVEDDEQPAQPQHGQPGHAHPHHRAAGERHFQRLAQAGARGLRGAHVGLGGDAHADEAGQRGEQGTEQERADDGGVRPLVRKAQVAQEQAGDHREHGQDPVLGLEEGEGPVRDVAGNGAHALVAGVLPRHPGRAPQGVQQGQHAEHGDGVSDRMHVKGWKSMTKGRAGMPAGGVREPGGAAPRRPRAPGGVFRMARNGKPGHDSPVRCRLGAGPSTARTPRRGERTRPGSRARAFARVTVPFRATRRPARRVAPSPARSTKSPETG